MREKRITGLLYLPPGWREGGRGTETERRGGWMDAWGLIGP